MAVREPLDALARLDEVFAEYAAEDADFDALAKEQEKLRSYYSNLGCAQPYTTRWIKLLQH